MDSKLLEFLLTKRKNHKDKSLPKILRYSDQKLDRQAKDVMPWLFPVDAPTPDNKVAPYLNGEEISWMHNHVLIQGAIRMGVRRIVDALDSTKVWVTPKSPTFLLIARMLRCMWLAGMTHEYVLLQKSLDEVFEQFPNVIGEETYYYWKMMNNASFFQKYPLVIPYDLMKQVAIPAPKTVGTTAEEMEEAWFGYI